MPQTEKKSVASADRKEIILRMPTSLHTELRRLVGVHWERNTSLNSLIVDVLSRYVEHEKKLEENRASKKGSK